MIYNTLTLGNLTTHQIERIDLSNVTSLLLSNSGLNDTKMSILVRRLPESLIELVLDRNNISDLGVFDLVEIRARLPHLEILDLSSNPIRDTGAAALANFISHTNLKQLVLYHSHITDDGAIVLADALSSSALQKFYFGGDLTDTGIAALFYASKTLKSFDLRNDSISDEGIDALAFALQNTTLEKLHLSVGLTDVHMERLIEPFATTRIRHIDLSFNPLGDGIVFLAESLCLNDFIYMINLSHTHCGDAGARALAAALLVNKNLAWLNLGDNLITDVGASALRRSFVKVDRFDTYPPKNTSLVALNLINNAIGPVIIADIMTAIDLNAQRRQIHTVGRQSRTNFKPKSKPKKSKSKPKKKKSNQ